MASAEEVAERLRDQTERRIRERIGEADRAADLRVRAAEEEAVEILEGASKDASARRAAAGSAVEIREGAAAEARELVGAARTVSAETSSRACVSSDLQELSRALRANAERLLRDVQAGPRAEVDADLDEVECVRRLPGRRSAARAPRQARGGRLARA